MTTLRRIGAVLLFLAALAPGTATAQVAATPSVVVRQSSWASLSYEPALAEGHGHQARQSVLTNTVWRTVIFTAGTAAVALAITAATDDGSGWNDAETTALVAGALTGAVFSLVIWPLLHKH